MHGVEDNVVRLKFATRWDRAKKWVVDHQEGVLIGGTIAVVVGFAVILVKADSKWRAQRAIEHGLAIRALNDWAQIQRDAGETIYPLVTTQGSGFISVEK